MTPQQLAALQAVRQAQLALQRGEKRAARHLAEQALQLAPDIEEPWLMMASLASPRASVEYLQRALQINPESDRARKGMQWAIRRLRKHGEKQAPAAPEQTPGPTAMASRRPSFTALLVTLIACLALIWIAGFGGTSPAVASILGNIAPAVPANPGAWNVVVVEKPAYTATSTTTATATLVDTATPTFTATSTAVPTATITETPAPTETPWPTDTPHPAWTAAPPNNNSLPRASSSNGGRWIDINLSQQMLYAYEGDTLINSFVVSTGTWMYPTVTGQYHVYVKYRAIDMSGPGYYLPDVPNTMFFYKGYAIHGAYWHNNFGTPMSHGCVNMRLGDAAWIFSWASVGTLVNVHY